MIKANCTSLFEDAFRVQVLYGLPTLSPLSPFVTFKPSTRKPHKDWRRFGARLIYPIISEFAKLGSSIKLAKTMSI